MASLSLQVLFVVPSKLVAPEVTKSTDQLSKEVNEKLADLGFTVPNRVNPNAFESADILEIP